MEILGSYHNHTKYSKFFHGKNTVKEMCDKAKEVGFVQIALTDHASKHIFGVWPKRVKKLREEIDEYNKSTDEINVLMGMEFNLLGINGESDFSEEVAENLDIRCLGFHKLGNTGWKGFFTFLLPNIFCKKKMIEKNTDAYIKAIKKYKIDLITHPQDYIKVNLKRLAEACVENNCYLELNNRHNKVKKDEILEILDTGVKFLISTDAHSIKTINSFERAQKLIEESGIPLERVANIGALPDFKNKYTKD